MKELSLDAKKTVSSNIKRIRAEKGLTQVDLSRASGVTQATISRIESGEAWPDYDTIVSLCAALKCEHTEIISHPDLLEAFAKIIKVTKEQKKKT